MGSARLRGEASHRSAATLLWLPGVRRHFGRSFVGLYQPHAPSLEVLHQLFIGSRAHVASPNDLRGVNGCVVEDPLVMLVMVWPVADDGEFASSAGFQLREHAGTGGPRAKNSGVGRNKRVAHADARSSKIDTDRRSTDQGKAPDQEQPCGPAAA